MDTIKEVRKPEQTLFHGSPSSFKNFDLAYISTGFGRQLFGYGVYLTDNADSANTYSQGGYIYTVQVPAGRYLSSEGIGKKEAYSIALKFFDYYTKVDEYGREAYGGLEKEFWENECITISKAYNGTEVYGTISSFLGSDKRTSEWLRSIGYTGIVFSADNGATGEKFKNYVIFDANDIKIVKRKKIK